MDDPTKDTIPRSAVEYYLRKETVNTNPEAYESHERFIAYMDDPDISQFGHWMHSNGFNCALVSIAVDLEKIPSVTPPAQPGWIPTSEKLPERYDNYLITTNDEDVDIGTFHPEFKRWSICDADGFMWMDGVLAWCELPTPYREGGQDDES